MKVLITVKKRGWSGETAIILDLAVGLDARGHDVFLAVIPGSVSESRAKEHNIRTVNVRFETGPSKLPGQWRDFRELGRFIRDNEIDLIHTHASWDSWIGGFVAKMGPRRIPLVRTKHNLKRIRTHLFNRWLYNGLSDAIIAVSHAVKDHLSTCPIVNPSHVHLVPNGIRADLFRADGRDPGPVREKLGAHPGEVLVAFISRLSKRKNPESLIDAARKLADSGLPLKFIIAGSGSAEYQAKLNARAEGLDNLTFVGHWSDVPELLSAIDIFVLTSHIEPFGLAPLEAMSMQKAVIVSPADGFKDFMRSEGNGIVLERNDADCLAAAITRLAKDPDLRKKMGIEGRKTVETDFTSDVMVDRTIAFYEQVVAGIQNIQ